MDWREEATHMTEKDSGLAYCCLVVAESRNHRQDQTSGGLEVEADTKLHEQAAVASRKSQVFHGMPMDSMFEGQMAERVLRQVLKRA
jgi:hypothetical protein